MKSLPLLEGAMVSLEASSRLPASTASPLNHAPKKSILYFIIIIQRNCFTLAVVYIYVKVFLVVFCVWRLCGKEEFVVSGFGLVLDSLGEGLCLFCAVLFRMWFHLVWFGLVWFGGGR